MRKRLGTKALSALLALTMAAGMSTGLLTTAQASPSASAISAEEFHSPGMQYRPGVRWWWSMGTTTEELLEQIDYLAENNFGMIEIVPFNSGYITDQNASPMGATSADDTIYPDEKLYEYDNPAYYEKLETVIAAAAEKGIIVDLNMGSGYEASYKDITAEDSMENMALGRATVAVDSSSVGKSLEIAIPDAEVSPLYDSTANGVPMAEWTGVKKLQAIVFAKKDSNGTALAKGNQFIDLESGEISKSYADQLVLDIDHTKIIDMSEQDLAPGDVVSLTADLEGEWEVVALYSVPSGSFPIRGIYDHSYVVDHLDGAAVARFVNMWLGNEEGLKPIVEKYGDSIRAGFNDSYEFYTDKYFNYKVYDAAKSPETNGIGYDLTKYLPTLYKLGENCFTIGKINGDIAPYDKTTDNFLTYNIPEDEKTRITYDYNQLVNSLFLEGMESFSTELAKYGMSYRQQAYNPPIDTLKSSKYVGIPETEGLSEYSLRRVSSGAHLYGKNLVTSEVYTLGSTPYQCTPQFIKNGYDLMATSGVNNFFYHGLSSTYFGTEEAKADNAYGEYGWRGWPTIGIEVGQVNPIWPYFKTLNSYAARANYMMQQGSPSSDVAIYMPLFGSVTETEAVKTLNANGYTYDAINDDCIQNEISYQGGKIVVASSGMSYDALLIQSQTLPVETVQALETLAAQGAPILFYGGLPNKQPSFADGNYQALDQQVQAESQALLDNHSNVSQASSTEGLVSLLSKTVDTPISYAANTNIRMSRRALSDGGELAYIRNTSKQPVTVELKVDPSLTNCYWLDQNDGSIYSADCNRGTITLTLEAESAIGLLCEPQQYGFTDSDVSAGIPDSINTDAAVETIAVDGFSLTVTADNIGSALKGEETTATYTGQVFGDWASDEFNGGALKYVSDKGIYTANFVIDNLSTYRGKRAMLDLGTVHSPTTVYINGKEIGDVMFTPYAIDITSALRQGNNEIRIEMQPLAANRRAGFKAAYQQTGEQQYLYYEKYVGSTKTLATGIEGPISLELYPGDTASAVDTSILEKVIAYAQDQKDNGALDNVIPLVAEAYNTRLDTANALLNSLSATQQEVDEVWISLMEIIHYLDFIQGNKNQLDTAITYAESLNLDDYQEQGQAEFLVALAAAKNVQADENALQYEVDEARDNLIEATLYLLLKAGDKAQLNLVIRYAQQLELENYLDAGKQAFAEALEKAITVQGDKTAVQSAIDAAALELTDALLELRLKPDKTLLANLLQEAGSLDLSAYTAETAEYFASARDAAQAVYDNPQAAKAEVEQAERSLKAAMKALEEAPAIQIQGDGAATMANSSPKTGESLPVAAAAILLLAVAGATLSKKKK